MYRRVPSTCLLTTCALKSRLYFPMPRRNNAGVMLKSAKMLVVSSAKTLSSACGPEAGLPALPALGPGVPGFAFTPGFVAGFGLDEGVGFAEECAPAEAAGGLDEGVCFAEGSAPTEAAGGLDESVCFAEGSAPTEAAGAAGSQFRYRNP